MHIHPPAIQLRKYIMSGTSRRPERKILPFRPPTKEGEEREEMLAERLKDRFSKLREEGRSSKEAFLTAILELRDELEDEKGTGDL